MDQIMYLKPRPKVGLDQHMDETELKPVSILKDGLPAQAFAIIGDKTDPRTWSLPHHTKQVNRAVKGKVDYEHTLDWQMLEHCVQLLSHSGNNGQRVNASEGEILFAARHLAEHYRKAGKPLPDALAVLV